MHATSARRITDLVQLFFDTESVVPVTMPANQSIAIVRPISKDGIQSPVENAPVGLQQRFGQLNSAAGAVFVLRMTGFRLTMIILMVLSVVLLLRVI